VIAALLLAAGCTISSSGLRFGSYDALKKTPADAVATITYRCTGSGPARVSLGAGGEPNFDRRLRSGAASLRYNLYLDAARTQVWGDGTRGTGFRTLAPNGSGTLSIFARIHGGQNVPAGEYQDSILVAIDF